MLGLELSEGVTMPSVEEVPARQGRAVKVARGQALERYGMLNLCSRKWGLAISITRFIHFGKLPDP